MLTKKDKSKLRSTIFRHLDGIATSTSIYTLHKHKVLDHILRLETVDLHDLAKEFKANEGYLNVALRVVCSQGWLIQEINNETNQVTYKTNDNSKKAFELALLYEDVVNLLKYSDRFAQEKMISVDAFITLERIFKKFENKYGLVDEDESSIEFQVYIISTF